MPSRQVQDHFAMSMPNSPPPPTDIPSYARDMLDHTKRQMEASGASGISHTRSNGSSNSRGSSMTNGRHKSASVSTAGSDSSVNSKSSSSRRWWRRR